MRGKPQPTISILTADDVAADLQSLGALLHDCVNAGASVNFVLPYSPGEAVSFWAETVLPAVRAGGRTVLVANVDASIAGTVQLIHDTPPNQPHRAEVSKLLVHPDFRRRGIARALMADLEGLAGRMGRSLITLDTRTGDSAEPLYQSLGYTVAGVIPGYCRDTIEDRLDPTTIMYKVL